MMNNNLNSARARWAPPRDVWARLRELAGEVWPVLDSGNVPSSDASLDDGFVAARQTPPASSTQFSGVVPGSLGSRDFGHRTTIVMLLWFLLSAGPMSLIAADAAGSVSNGIPLCVMTFNLRYASATPPNAWPERRPVMRDCIRQVAPDLIGTQEGLYHQLKDIAADLPDYAWIGLGRDGGSHGEFMAVFYRRSRFEPLEYDHFWLSDTPEVMASSSWGNVCRRMVTWVRFRDRQTGRQFYFWNTHLDNAVALARVKSAGLIRKRMQTINTNLPVLLTGDFNCADGSSRPWDVLVKDGDLTDTWPLARTHVNERLNSFHGYQKPKEAGVRIDWILARGGVRVDKAEVCNYSENGQCPSDHFPVVAWLALGLNQTPHESPETH